MPPTTSLTMSTTPLTATMPTKMTTTKTTAKTTMMLPILTPMTHLRRSSLLINIFSWTVLILFRFEQLFLTTCAYFAPQYHRITLLLIWIIFTLMAVTNFDFCIAFPSTLFIPQEIAPLQMVLYAIHVTIPQDYWPTAILLPSTSLWFVNPWWYCDDNYIKVLFPTLLIDVPPNIQWLFLS